MKKTMMILLLTLFAGTLAAQQPKTLSLEETVAAVYKKQLIDSLQKRRIDSLILKLKFDRRELALQQRKGTVNEADFKVREKKVSQNFTDSLKKILGGDVNFKKWQAVRYPK